MLRSPATIALALAAAVLRAAPDPAVLATAQALYESGKFIEARQPFEQLALANPADPTVNHYLGQLANRRNEPEKATAYFERAIAAEPRAGRHHHGLGDAHGRHAQKAGMLSKFGLAKKCLAAYQRAVELEPGNADFHHSLFEYYRQAPAIAGGGFDKASAAAAAIKHIDPNRGHVAFGVLYAGEKKFDQALAEFEAALASKPDHYAALYQVGRLAAISGRFVERGVTALRRCLELPAPTAPELPGHAVVQWRLGTLLEKQSDAPGARAADEAALRLDSTFAPAAEALKKLK